MVEKAIGVFLILLGVVLVLAIIAAVYSEIKDSSVKMGFVIKKEFRPAHTTMSYTYNSTYKTTTPIARRHPDAWYLWVRGIDIDGRERTRQVRVSEKEFNRTPLNDFWEEK